MLVFKFEKKNLSQLFLLLFLAFSSKIYHFEVQNLGSKFNIHALEVGGRALYGGYVISLLNWDEVQTHVYGER